MDLKNILLIVQIVISIALMITILMQRKGASLGAAFGGGGGGGGYYQKRGAEKLFYNATIVLSILFIGIAFVILVIS